MGRSGSCAIEWCSACPGSWSTSIAPWTEKETELAIAERKPHRRGLCPPAIPRDWKRRRCPRRHWVTVPLRRKRSPKCRSCHWCCGPRQRRCWRTRQAKPEDNEEGAVSQFHDDDACGGKSRLRARGSQICFFGSANGVRDLGNFVANFVENGRKSTKFP